MMTQINTCARYTNVYCNHIYLYINGMITAMKPYSYYYNYYYYY